MNNKAIKTAVNIIPDPNLVISSQSGYHSGHIAELSLKYESYVQLRDKEKLESQIS